MEDTKSEQATSSKYQIDQLNQQRPKPMLTYAPSPQGPAWIEVHTQETIKRNNEIDHRIATMQKRLAERRSQARSAFNKASGSRSI